VNVLAYQTTLGPPVINWQSLWAALVTASAVMVTQELLQLQCDVLSPGPLYPHPICTEKDSSEVLWQISFGWETTL